MTPEYNKAEGMVEDAIKNRIISLSGKKAQRYEQGDYKPMFSLCDRDGELICIHCANRKNKDHEKPNNPYDIEILRLSYSDVFDGLLKADGGGKAKSWAEVTRAVMRYFRMRPGD